MISLDQDVFQDQNIMSNNQNSLNNTIPPVFIVFILYLLYFETLKTKNIGTWQSKSK